MVDTLGPRRTAVLEAWGERVVERESGRNFDFGDGNRTRATQRHVDAFLTDPDEERFEELWQESVLGDAVMGGTAPVLANHDGSVEAVAETFREMRDADAYDAAWESRFLIEPVVWELFGRLHPEEAPVLNSTCRTGLSKMGFSSPKSFEEACEEWESFREVYESVVGHATTGTDHEVPLGHEMSEFLWFVARTDADEIASVLREDDDEYLPITGWHEESPLDQDLQLSGHERHIDGFVEAEREGGFADEDEDDLWNDGHWEDWKDAYLDHMDDVVRPQYDFANLSAAEVEPLLDDLTETATISDTIPSYLLGGRSGGILWTEFCDYSEDNAEDAAEVLSYLFDETVDLTLRLDRFDEFYGALDTTGGPRMSLATMLLTFVYPDDYVFYKYGRMNDFFGTYGDYDVEQGFNPGQYWKLNDACNRQLLSNLAERLEEKEPTMLDVYTLLYVWDSKYNDT